MKHNKLFTTILIVALSATITAPAYAATIPRETAPINAAEEQIQIVENLIGNYLDEINAGAGYGMIASEADTKIYKAVLSGQTNGNGYAILSAISQNALRICRDMYMRPDTYAYYEETLKVQLADIITAVENGADYDTSFDNAYTRLYQSVNPSYTPPTERQDFCYLDIPAIDNAAYTVTRKLLLNAHNTYLQNQ